MYIKRATDIAYILCYLVSHRTDHWQTEFSNWCDKVSPSSKICHTFKKNLRVQRWYQYFFFV